MNKFIISTDSNCDLPADICEKYNIPIIFLNYCFDNIIYGSENQMSTKKFYERLRSGEKPTTMAVNTEDAKDRFEDLVKAGYDIIHISFSSALSCTYQNVCIAADELKEEYPAAKITVIDSLCASLGQGLLVYKAIMYMQDNHTYKEVIDYAEHIKLNISHRFTVDSLEHLHRGGRISKSASIIGSLINIKPMLYVNDSGALVPTGKIRGRKKSLLELANLLINEQFRCCNLSWGLPTGCRISGRCYKRRHRCVRYNYQPHKSCHSLTFRSWDSCSIFRSSGKIII